MELLLKFFHADEVIRTIVSISTFKIKHFIDDFRIQA